jgi:tetratricopeptide (TPR) repeat protein/DNA-binding CsgD family transcriptional regulator
MYQDLKFNLKKSLDKPIFKLSSVTIFFVFVFTFPVNAFQISENKVLNNSGKLDQSKMLQLQNQDIETYRKVFQILDKKWSSQNNQDELIKLYELHSDYVMYHESNDSLISILHAIKDKLKSKKEIESLKTYILLGQAFYFQSNYDSMVYWKNQADRLITKNSPYFGLYLILQSYKSYYEESYLDAIEHALQAGKIFENEQNKMLTANVYNNIALSYDRLGNIEYQQDYLKKAIEINKNQGYRRNLIMNYNNLGSSYRKQGKLTEALEVYDAAYQELQVLQSPFFLAQNLTNRANILEKLGDFSAAEKLFLECEAISTANNIPYGIMLSNINLGNLYRQMGLYTKARERLDHALDMTETLKTSREKALTFERLSWLARDRRDYENAYLYLQKYNVLNDSLINESVKKESIALKEKYEAEKKENEIISLSKDKLYQRYIISSLGLGIFVLIFIVYGWRQKYLRQKEERQKEEQRLKFQLELKEKELLADSLKEVSVMHTKESIFNELKVLTEEMPKTQAHKFSKILKELGSAKDEQTLREFESRFLGVYEGFYAKLRKTAPDLTPNEQRVAALIRLNFSSKEMAMITNRSVGTIDNVRSNIRKKLQLADNVDLVRYLSSF